MMPSPVTYWLQQIVMAILLLGVILLLVLSPARHVLAPLWPAAVDELILPGKTDQAERVLLLAGPAYRSGQPAAIVRSRPRSVVAMERRGEPPSFGYLAGYRDEPGAPLQSRLPDELQVPRVELPLDDSRILVMVLADEQLVEMPADELVALYRPNQLSPTDRIGLLTHRVIGELRQSWF